MHPHTIERFFRILADEFGQRATVIVTGAAAGSLWGYLRPSRELEFGVQLTNRTPRGWEVFQAAVDRAAQQTGMQPNYTEDIARWSSLSLPDYRAHTLFYRRFGKFEVRMLDPVYWSIGKLSRDFDLDVRDVVTVFTRKRIPVRRLLLVWGEALRASPHSTAVLQFRAQVEQFLRTHGRTIWGRRFSPEVWIHFFSQAAGIRVKSPPA